MIWNFSKQLWQYFHQRMKFQKKAFWYNPTHSLTLLHTPSHTFTLPHTPSLPHTHSHSLTLPLTPSHSITLSHTPSHFLTLTHSHSHTLTLPNTPSHTLILPHTSHTPSHTLTLLTLLTLLHTPSYSFTLPHRPHTPHTPHSHSSHSLTLPHSHSHSHLCHTKVWQSLHEETDFLLQNIKRSTERNAHESLNYKTGNCYLETRQPAPPAPLPLIPSSFHHRNHLCQHHQLHYV